MTVTENLINDGLLARLSEGYEQSFAVLYRRHSGPVYRFALRMSGDRELAEDVVQEVFLTLMRDARRYDATRGALATWLCGMARNHVLRRLALLRSDGPFPD